MSHARGRRLALGELVMGRLTGCPQEVPVTPNSESPGAEDGYGQPLWPSEGVALPWGRNCLGALWSGETGQGCGLCAQEVGCGGAGLAWEQRRKGVLGSGAPRQLSGGVGVAASSPDRQGDRPVGALAGPASHTGGKICFCGSLNVAFVREGEGDEWWWGVRPRHGGAAGTGPTPP